MAWEELSKFQTKYICDLARQSLAEFQTTRFEELSKIQGFDTEWRGKS